MEGGYHYGRNRSRGPWCRQVCWYHGIMLQFPKKSKIEGFPVNDVETGAPLAFMAAKLLAKKRCCLGTWNISKCKRKRHWTTAKSMGLSYVLKGRKEDAYERKINPMENLSLYESKKNWSKNGKAMDFLDLN